MSSTEISSTGEPIGRTNGLGTGSTDLPADQFSISMGVEATDEIRGVTKSMGSDTSPGLNDDLVSFGHDHNGSQSFASWRAEYHHQRSASSLSSFAQKHESSILLGVNTLSESSISPLGKNSIFELVQNINYNKRATSSGQLLLGSAQALVNLKGPTNRDIPSTQLAKIEKIKSPELRNHSESLENDYFKFKQNKTLTASTLEALICRLDQQETINSENDIHLKFNYDDFERQKADLDQNSLSCIPEVYFDSDFRLDDPKIFSQILKNKTILDDTTDFNPDGTKKLKLESDELQENLSSYLDIVEVQLIREISKSSGSFFSALDDLKSTTAKSKNLVTRLRKLDARLQRVEEAQANRAMEILDLTKKRENVEKLEQALVQIFTILHQADMAESSYYNANYSKALELADSVFALIRGNNPPHPLVDLIAENWPFRLLDMNRISALSPLKKLLVNLVADTGKSYSKLFNDTLINDLRDHYEHVSQIETLRRLDQNLSRGKSQDTNSINLDYEHLDEHFISRLKEYLNGLARCGELKASFNMYQEKFLSELKGIIRANLPSENTDNVIKGSISGLSDGTRSTSTQNNGSGGLASTVKTMTPREFEDLLVKTYTQLSEALRRLTTHRKILLGMTLDAIAAFDPSFTENQPDMALDFDLTNAIAESIDIVQRRMAKIINVRESQNSSITLEYFMRFFSLNAMFLVECELISSGASETSALQDVMSSQLKKFIIQYHRTTSRIASQLIEKETWKECTISSSTQMLLNQILDASSGDFDESLWLEPYSIFNTTYNQDAPQVNSSERKTIMIDGKSMIVPEVTSDILKMIKSYLLIKIKFGASNDNYIIEFLRLVNSKCHQAVLGAQATRTAGLKHITPKYLAVASQFVGFLFSLTPYLQRFFGKYPKTDAHIEKEFQKVAELFHDHQVEIFDKLTTLMTDRINVHAVEIKSIDWSNPLQHQQVHQYMETIVKETLTIARVLQRYLPEEQYARVLSSIFRGYERSLIDIYTKIGLKDSLEKAVVMRDIDYFRDRLNEVTGYENSGQRIWECVNMLSTEEESRMEAMMRNNSTEEKCIEEERLQNQDDDYPLRTGNPS
ncbi:hypothetical protein KL905_005223 [Ogataea polymorpha]|uniref:Vacuolar protein sorting-associated protein 54 C-terminal domain-containing protein n=2 Tax=Saccharomycotina TaxID=147537 RepID=A0A9P8NTI1_9ASCO|nr:hypothetical protein KL937_005233 [Ogataea polymorpha]KAG7888553.1 hypothetical protein KL908_005100 [Ogataea polymorpha]KAG7897361.1 hypothetical protein KL935_005170 [Ogataea polymorpha]KAG7898513.1 hypothetical protein KL907_005273 [Ogataea polymorpha]KAG7914939.1 hypothetical protein KL905_005223 [Ogataea polymorpha]